MKTCIPFYWMIEGGGHSHKFTLIHPCMRESSTKPHVSLVSGILLFLRYQHVASFSKRMESTGRTSRVRVTAHCPPFLRDPTDSLYRSIWGGSGLGYADQLIGGPLTGGMPLDRRQSYGRHDASGTASPDCPTTSTPQSTTPRRVFPCRGRPELAVPDVSRRGSLAVRTGVVDVATRSAPGSLCLQDRPGVLRRHRAVAPVRRRRRRACVRFGRGQRTWLGGGGWPKGGRMVGGHEGEASGLDL